MIATILQRIAANNPPVCDHETPFTDGLYAGRREAYEDVLRILGYYDAQDQVQTYDDAGEAVSAW